MKCGGCGGFFYPQIFQHLLRRHDVEGDILGDGGNVAGVADGHLPKLHLPPTRPPLAGCGGGEGYYYFLYFYCFYYHSFIKFSLLF